MRTRLLLGPAGAGKTFRCLAEAREELAARPEGPPLVFLAPRQATFQLERQLLADPALAGYTRLQILSFERFAEFLLERVRRPPPPLLSEQGRVMVLRALLARERDRLRTFRAAARLPGFAGQVGAALRELAQHRVGPGELERLLARGGLDRSLGDKLRDLALLARAYRGWLAERRLQDADALLDQAARAWAEAGPDAPPLGRLWLDGFADLTPQHLELLAVVLPRAGDAALAFCLEREPADELPWVSPWSEVARTVRRVRERLEGVAGVEVAVEVLPRRAAGSRFDRSPVLRHLESSWTRLEAGPAPAEASAAALPVRLAACANPEAEVRCAAREILRFVRSGRGRFRDLAVLVRSLDTHGDALRRVFRACDIPFFLDRREPVAHHPLAELTRGALRTVAYGWQHEDWFGALKTGLTGAEEAGVDELENAALARGWKGRAWREPLGALEPPGTEAQLEHLRRRATEPFLQLERALGAPLAFSKDEAQPALGLEPRPQGTQLAAAVRAFWQALRVQETLDRWSASGAPGTAAVFHRTVWDEMNRWLEAVELAFAQDGMTLPEWLAVLETGLSSLSVGLIPPALDQVLVGAIDRSRNPELKLALVLGLNEGVFPAPPPAPVLLTEAERGALLDQGVELGPDRARQLGRERFLAYVAFTRSSGEVAASYALRGTDDQPLSPSWLVGHLQRSLPSLVPRSPPALALPAEAEHPRELLPAWLRQSVFAPPAPGGRAALAPALPGASFEHLRPADPRERLEPSLAKALYGPGTLRSSVSRLEQFAACPFKFFVQSGLRAEERVQFEVDARKRGSFLHHVLERFHQDVQAEGRRWRDLSPAEARERIGRLAEAATTQFEEGLFLADDQSLFTARSLALALEHYLQTAIDWMRSYRFDPRAVEVRFGQDGPLPAWELALDDAHRLCFQGIIDRVDLWTEPETGRTFCVVIDYKSQRKTLDPLLLEHGVQLQLPAYLAALVRSAKLEPVLGVGQVEPAGAFYVNLRGNAAGAKNRRQARADAGSARGEAYQHRGRFDLGALPGLDPQGLTGEPTGQFSYARGGKPNGRYRDPVGADALAGLLAGVEAQLRRIGRAIFAGEAAVDPYQKGARDDACQRCDYAPICRIDPWTHPFRRLRPAATPQDGPEEA